jgi:hypothetical protein
MSLPPLVKNQHFHSAHAISKFCAADNLVEIYFKNQSRAERKGKNAKNFTTRLTWNQNAELGYMRSIEEKFHNEMNDIKDRQNRNHNAITQYHLLWSLRFDFALDPHENEAFPSLTPPHLTPEDQDAYDRMGIYYLKQGGTFSSNHVAGIQIFGHLSSLMDQYKELQWGLLEASDGEFLVSDNYLNIPYMPISPTLAFIANQPDQKISRQQLTYLNKISASKAKLFYFARHLSLCPVS